MGRRKEREREKDAMLIVVCKKSRRERESAKKGSTLTLHSSSYFFPDLSPLPSVTAAANQAAVTAVTALTTHGTDQVNGQEDAKNGRGREEGGGEALLLEAQGKNSSAAEDEDGGHQHGGIWRVNKLVKARPGIAVRLKVDGRRVRLRKLFF